MYMCIAIGQPKFMPRAERKATECFVSTTDVQILQNILDLVHTAGITNYVCVRYLTRARNNFTVVISRICKRCIPGLLLSFGRGLGTRLHCNMNYRYDVHVHVHCNKNVHVQYPCTLYMYMYAHV